MKPDQEYRNSPAQNSGTRNPQQPRNSESEKDNTLFCKICPFWLFYSFEVFLSVLGTCADSRVISGSNSRETHQTLTNIRDRLIILKKCCEK